jgi:hypothetical protein
LVKAAFAAVFVEVLELTCAPELPVETEVLFETVALLCGAEVCARAVPTIRLPKTNEARTIFIAIILRRGPGRAPRPEWQLRNQQTKVQVDALHVLLRKF